MKVPGIEGGTYGKLENRVTVGELPEIGSKDGWPGILLPDGGLPDILPLDGGGPASGGAK